LFKIQPKTIRDLYAPYAILRGSTGSEVGASEITDNGGEREGEGANSINKNCGTGEVGKKWEETKGGRGSGGIK
jgi:hypothetical protein